MAMRYIVFIHLSEDDSEAHAAIFAEYVLISHCSFKRKDGAADGWAFRAVCGSRNLDFWANLVCHQAGRPLIEHGQNDVNCEFCKKTSGFGFPADNWESVMRELLKLGGDILPSPALPSHSRKLQ